MVDKPSQTPSDFIAAVYGQAGGNVFVCALPNERGGHREFHVATRDRLSIDGFVAKRDRAGSAIYYCTGTLTPGAQPTRPGGSPRCKENVAWIVGLYSDTDLKSVETDRDGIVSGLRGLMRPPSVIVWSGRGAQGLWLFNEPLEASPENIERVEALNALLSDVVGGDPVQDVCRLLRMPGSHNTKDGGWLAVEVVHARYEPRYEIDDLDEWLSWASPAIQRKTPERARGTGRAEPDDPYLRIAAEQRFKVPLDVEQRLAQMSYQGVGEASIHNTQLAVSASLLNQGEDIEDVVAVLIEATRAAAGADGARWRWDREERAIRRMCQDWQRKHPEAKPKLKLVSSEGGKAAGSASEASQDEVVREASKGATVHQLREERVKRKAGKRGDEGDVTVVLGSAVLEALRDEGGAILFMSKAAWIYAGGLWRMEIDIAPWLNVRIESAIIALNLKSNSRTVNEVRNWIMRRPELWRDAIEWDGHGKINTRTGLVDPNTLTVEPARPEHHCTWRIECAFDPAAPCPWWDRMLADFFGDKVEADRGILIALLQEILGMALVEEKSKALTKALVLQGGSDSGKTSVLEVMSGLLSDRPISMPLDAIGGPHGLMEFVRRAPWVLNEAFDQSKWHFSALVKSILTGDPVQINIKSGPLLTQRVRAPVFWGTNHPPQFKEATKAIVNRLIVLKCRQAFEENAPVGAAREARAHGYAEPSQFILATEMPGLLNWAIHGLRRAQERGHFALPQEVVDTRAEIRSDSNLVDGFMRECVTLSAYGMISTPDFCAAFTVWWHENKGENRGGPSNEAIGKALVSLGDARISSHRDLERRYYLGVTLNASGLDYWRASSASYAAQGKTSRISSEEASVNRGIPSGWDDKEHVRRLRAEFKRRPDKPPDKPPEDGPEGHDSSHDSSHDSAGFMTVGTVMSGETVF